MDGPTPWPDQKKNNGDVVTGSNPTFQDRQLTCLLSLFEVVVDNGCLADSSSQVKSSFFVVIS